MKPGIVQRIFNDHFYKYSRDKILHSREKNAAISIMTCRTPIQGYHIDACPNDDYQTTVLNSCRHRACPQCGATSTQLWLERRKAQALDCPYFHVVFTISHDLHIIWRYNRKLFTSLLMQGAWHSLRELLLDWRHLGGLVGAVAAFQSWGDEMQEHCHLHFIVTAGGLTEDGRWVRSGEKLLWGPTLARKFRGKFLAYLKEAFSPYIAKGKAKLKEKILRPPAGMSVQQCLNLFNRLGRISWHVDIEPKYEHANGVFKYLGRYIRRGPISERRIIGYDGYNVTIAYPHQEKQEKPTFKMDTHSFIRRILSHVPEKGTHVVRSFGLFHPNCRDKLNLARKLLGQVPYEPSQKIPTAQELLSRLYPDKGIGRCPYCRSELRTVFIYRGGSGSEWRLAA
jgi:hypothetical protein